MELLPPQLQAMYPTAEWVWLSRKDPESQREDGWWVAIFDKAKSEYLKISRKLYEQWVQDGFDGLDQIPEECLVDP